jgi:hypothetical protein
MKMITRIVELDIMHDHVTRVSPVVGAGGPCAVRFGDDRCDVGPNRKGPLAGIDD